MDSEQYGRAADYGTEERQKKLLATLKMIHGFCTEHGIEYSLAYGSLLGAIRHGGFIPWDDDADIMMSRENYTKFTKEFHGTDEYFLETEMWIDRVRKIGDEEGAVDIMVFDNVPSGRFKYKFKIFLLKMLQGMLRKDLVIKGSFVNRACIVVTYGIGKLFPKKLKYGWYKKASAIGNKDKNVKYCNVFNLSYKALPRKYTAGIMDEVEPHRFEDSELYIISRYDEYLKQKYGDYMKPPTMEDRLSGSYEAVRDGKVVRIDGRFHN